MSTCNRSFVIILAIVRLMFDQPVAALSIHRAKTTTLKSYLDLATDESAFQLARHDIPKINNIKILEGKDLQSTQTLGGTPTRTSTNVVGDDKKPSSSVISNSTKLATNSLEPKQDEKPRNETEISTVDATEAISVAATTDANNIKTTEVDRSTTEDKCENCNTVMITNSNTLADSEVTTNEITIAQTTHIPQTVSHANETPVIYETETMVTDASQSNNNKNWKTYTTIERKRTTKEDDAETVKGTEVNQQTTKSDLKETDVVDTTTVVSTDPGHQFTNSHSRMLDLLDLDTILSTYPAHELTDSESQVSDVTVRDTVAVTVASNENKVKLTTNLDTTTENNAVTINKGFINQAIKKVETSTLNSNEWALRSDFFDATGPVTDSVRTTVAINENAEKVYTTKTTPVFTDTFSPEEKTTPVVTRNQLMNDAITEELMQEDILKDQIQSKIETTTEDALSVRPINTKTIYTVSPNYKPMKKIEVQPSKPYIRDPDDNSWRNESLSLLGIVFKAKNASKPFTEVLKNKTEAELNNMSEKDYKNEVTDLKERLGKITEVRKSKKKKVNKLGETSYSDYEESLIDDTKNTVTPSSIAPSSSPRIPEGKQTFDTITTLAFKPEPTTIPTTILRKETTEASTVKPNNKYLEYYDTPDEYDIDYVTMPKFDIKKFTTTSLKPTQGRTTPPITFEKHSPFMFTYLPDRKPTVQYFPPRPKPAKVNVNDYDIEFQKKVNYYTLESSTKSSPTTKPTTSLPSIETSTEILPQIKPVYLDKDLYVTFPSLDKSHSTQALNNDNTYNRASYVIKHFKDLVNDALRVDYDKGIDILPFTETPIKGLTISDTNSARIKTSMDEDYDYISDSKKSVVNHFINSFNDNSERFKVDFPILYNSSVVHSKVLANGKGVASSTALMKMLNPWPGGVPRPEPCEPNCHLKVELSPAYELHYYVPDQEEKEEAEKSATIQYFNL